MVAAAMLAVASPALANQIQVGFAGVDQFTGLNQGTFGPFQSGQGGEFTLNDINPDSWLNLSGYVNGVTSNFGPAGISSFQTFCVERTEFIGGYSQVYNAQLNTHAMFGSTGSAPGDPISAGTGWLYSQFAQGLLAGYAYAGTEAQREASADALQRAFWILEDEIPVEANIFITLLVSQPQFGSLAAAQAGSGTQYGVYAVNLWTGSDPNLNRAQDQLVFSVPDRATTLALFGFGLAAMAALARRSRRI